MGGQRNLPREEPLPDIGGYGPVRQGGIAQSGVQLIPRIRPTVPEAPTLRDLLAVQDVRSADRDIMRNQLVAVPQLDTRIARSISCANPVTNRSTVYEFPTDPTSSFGRAMSTFASGNGDLEGRVSGSCQNNVDQDFHREVSQALALKMNFKTKQYANEKVLSDLQKTGGSTADLRSALQAHAAIYGESLNPS